MIIELKGVEFENKGAELMLCAILQRIATYWPDAEIALTPSKKAPFLKRCSVHAWQKLSLRKLYFDLNGLTDYLPIFARRYLKKWGIVTEADIDVVLDASGFLYSEQWDPSMTIRHLHGELKRCHTRGKPYIFLPQAFGPFSEPQTVKRIQHGFPQAALVCAREADSLAHIQTITGPFSGLKQFGDFTNGIAGVAPQAHQQPVACIIPNCNMVSSRNKDSAWLNRYKQLILDVITLYRQHGLAVFFLNHEGDKDAALIDAINRALDVPLKVVTEPDPIAVKGIIASSDAVFSSRFHGCVSALSSGVACLATSWSHKYEQLYRDYDAQCLMLHPDYTAEQLAEAVSISLDKQNTVHQVIASRGEALKAETEAMWALVKETVDRYLQQ